MPANYVSKGVWLSKWLSELRFIGEGKRKKKLTDEHRTKLEAIGVTFGKLAKDNDWYKQFEKAKAFYDKHGTLDVDDKKTSSWIITQRQRYKNGKLSEELIQKLESIGIVWEFEDPFEVGFTHAEAYFRIHSNLLVSDGYVCDDGYALGHWINNVRNRREHRLSDEQISRLENIGIIWNVNEYRWEQGFAEAEFYYKEYSSLTIDVHYRTGRTSEVYYWVAAQRELYRDGKLSEEQIKRLESIGMDWLTPLERAWENGFEKVERYVKTNKSVAIPSTY